MHLSSVFLLMLAIAPGESRPSRDDKISPSHSPLESDTSPLGRAPLIIDSGNPPQLKTPSSCNYAWPTILAPIASVQSCQDYLEAPDMQATGDCSVPPPPINENPKGDQQPPPSAFGSRVLCQQSDNTVVMGATFNLYGTSSACHDVARAMQWILDQCAIEGQVAGADARVREWGFDRGGAARGVFELDGS
ncbi:hypothetical protein PG984_016437 [Apiospora sp. TS-2023a]